jgi:uncharacterized integral membrane protein (TIGR00698 family)
MIDPPQQPANLRDRARLLAPGVSVAVVLGMAATFISEHYGAPAMLMALLLGIAFHFLAEEGKCVEGIDFAARTVLRIGVALLGVRISLDLLVGLGPALIALVVCAVIATIAFGTVAARFLGRSTRFGLLTGGSVAICGASAAMAIAAVLPRNEKGEKDLIFTVLAVTVMGTLAMIFYPMLAAALGLDTHTTGLFLGATIHDVAQVVGAGFSVSEDSGETATLVKLIRVSMLAPVVLVFTLVYRDSGDGPRPPLIPAFVLGFIALAAINSTGIIPAAVGDALSTISRAALLIAIAAVGMKTSLASMVDMGGQAVALIIAQTAFIACFVLAGILLLG